MAFALIDDRLTDHPKIMQAGPLAGWLYVCGLTYCTRLLTDGFIPTGQVHKLADLPPEEVTALVTRLLTAQLWEEVDGGYRIHDYLKHNPTAAEVKAKRAKTAERQLRWKRAHLDGSIKEGANGVSNASPDASPDAPLRRVANAVSNAASRPSHSSDSLSPTERGPDADAPAAPTLRAVPKPARAERSTAPAEPPHPALLIAREVLQLHRPDQTQRAAILAAVADEPDALARWQRCCTAWRLAGFNVRNIAGPLEWFADGGPPEPDKSRGRNGNGSRAAPPIRSVADLAAHRLKLMQENGYDDDEHFTNGTGGRGGVAAELSGVPGRHGPAHQQLPAPRGG